jgi:mannose-6-phosphate isomerase-like protein (cupin superfamily)
MPKWSKDTLEAQDYGPVVDRQAVADGHTFNYTHFKVDMDATPLMKGLPGDRCHCPHWGYVIRGKITFHFDDHEEVMEAGDAFYLPPGHIPVVEAGTEYIQFSPSKELAEVSEHLIRATRAMQEA